MPKKSLTRELEELAATNPAVAKAAADYDRMSDKIRSNPGYDTSIHSNMDASAWAKFFCETWPNVYPDQPVPDEGWMLGWFANAMMAMHDGIKQAEAKEQQRASEIPS